tara:strand:+ start:8415 stop:9464 length:1050 start_codon:yes stop_codon:yes gene_type:complete
MLYRDNYIDYIKNIDNCNFHTQLKFLYKQELDNLIIYGPQGTGKYSQSLKYIQQYSPSNLKYEKKLMILVNRNEYIIRISDIHYEIDFEQLGCNAKTTFNEIYNTILENVSRNCIGIILCKNFHMIDNELLDIFYSYMQKIINTAIILKFVILTDSLSFIGNNIINCCNIVYLKKPKINKILLYYKTKLKDYKQNCKIENIYNSVDNINTLNNINSLENDNSFNNVNNSLGNINTLDNLNNYKLQVLNNKLQLNNNNICDNIVNEIISSKLQIITIRNLLYELLIYNYNIYNSLYYIIKLLITSKKIKCMEYKFFYNTGIFFLYYNNNYRPIFHLEKYILYLIRLVNGV